MIREQYVSFKTAKLLKECGFPQFVTLDIGEKVYSTTFCYGEDGRRHLYATASYDPDYIAAPTQAQAMRWLREEKRIVVEPLCNLYGG